MGKLGRKISKAVREAREARELKRAEGRAARGKRKGKDKKGGSMVLKCRCLHKGQDLLHGEGWRVANRAPKAESAGSGVKCWRCSVCGSLHYKG